MYVWVKKSCIRVDMSTGSARILMRLPDCLRLQYCESGSVVVEWLPVQFLENLLQITTSELSSFIYLHLFIKFVRD